MIQRRLGAELRRIREDRNLRLEEVAAELEVSASKISRLETGRAIPKVWDVRNLLALYGVQDERLTSRLINWANEVKAGGWWNPLPESVASDLEYFFSLEAESAAIQMYCAPTIPGLLQTEEYARALLSAYVPDSEEKSGVVANLVASRIQRQQVVTRPDDPIDLHAIIDEAGLRRLVGSREVMRSQLASLLERTKLSNVRVQVFPFDHGPHQAITGSFTIFKPRLKDLDPTIVNIEGISRDIFEDNDAELFEEIFNSLSVCSLDDAESRTMITEMLQG